MPRIASNSSTRRKGPLNARNWTIAFAVADELRQDQPRQDPPRRGPPRKNDGQRRSLIALGVVVLLFLVGWILAREIYANDKVEDCVLAGRTNCVPIDTQSRYGARRPKVRRNGMGRRS